MTHDEIISGLRDLIRDRQSFFSGDSDDDIFRRDAAVLDAAIAAVGNLEEVIDNPGLGLCVICQYGPEAVSGRHCGKCFGCSKFRRRLTGGEER